MTFRVVFFGFLMFFLLDILMIYLVAPSKIPLQREISKEENSGRWWWKAREIEHAGVSCFLIWYLTLLFQVLNFVWFFNVFCLFAGEYVKQVVHPPIPMVQRSVQCFPYTFADFTHIDMDSIQVDKEAKKSFCTPQTGPIGHDLYLQFLWVVLGLDSFDES